MSKRQKTYCIRNSKGEYWSNDFGWMVLENPEDDTTFSIFTEEEKQKFNLPNILDSSVRWEEL